MTTRNRALLADARLYLCTDGRRERGDFEAFVNAAYAGGVDVIQLREKGIEARDELELLEVLADAAARHSRLWSVNDRADIAVVSGAPVLHVGQRDLPPATARRLVHPEVIVGASTHDPEQLTTALGNPDVDYYCVGPVWSTPTKPGRPAAGLELVRAAAATAGDKPWFAIGGIDDERLDEVLAAGATRIVVVRVITAADDPEAAAAGLTQRLRRND